jgi:hypothetical protein
MAAAERLDGGHDRVELVDALHDDRQRLHQVLALGGHVGVGEQALQRRVELEQAGVEDRRGLVGDRGDHPERFLDQVFLVRSHRRCSSAAG